MVKTSKKTKEQINRRNVKAANVFGAFLYFNVIIQWFIAIALFIPVIIGFLNAMPRNVVVEEPTSHASTQSADPTLFTFLGASLLIVVILGLTIYTLAKMPAAVAKTGRDVVKKSSTVVTTSVIKATKKRDGKRVRERLTPLVAFYIKLLLVVGPVLLTILAGALGVDDLSPLIALFLSAALAFWSMLLMLMQYGTARRLAVKPVDLW